MSLKDKLLEDLKLAMRDKSEVKKNAIQMTRAAVLQVEKDNKVTLDDDGVIEIIAKEVKKRKDSLPEYEKSGRQDLIEKLKLEIEILMRYLPQQMTSSEIEACVKQVVEETGATSMKDMGKVMQAVKQKTTGRADMKEINELVKKMLSN